MQLLKHGVEEEIRKTGIDVIGGAPWGTHFCQFYETKEDLIDVLVPYFKVGLENNEFCMWVTSEPLSKEEVEKAMRKAVPDFDRYLKRGQMEIVPHAEWYLKDGVFNLRRVLDAWVDKLDQALAKGYDGIRVTGNTAWLEKNDWRSFVDYEREVNDVIGKYRMMAICTYSLDKCGASEVIDVVRNHHFALVKRRGEWELIESSELKRTEDALRRSEEKFSTIFENTTDVITYVDKHGKILEVNKRVEDVLGYKRDEIVGKNFAKLGLIGLKNLPKILRLFTSTIRKGKAQELVELELKHKNGNKVLVEVGTRFIEKNGEVKGVVNIFRDITERKRAEEYLKESEERYRTLAQISPVGIFRTDLEGNPLFVNKRWCEIAGISFEESLRDGWVKALHPDDRERIYKEWQAFVEGERPYEVECRFLHENGEIRWVLGKAIAETDEGGAIKGYVGTVTDITERKKMEETLRESEEKYRTQFDEALDAILLADAKTGIIIDCNRAASELVGREKSELVGKHQRILHPPEEIEGEFSRTFKQHLKEKEGQVLETQVITKKGEIKDVAIKANVFELSGKKLIQGIFRDITERKQMEEVLRRSEGKFRNIFESANDAMIYLDRSGRILDVNRKAVDVFGGSRKKLLGKHFTRVGIFSRGDMSELESTFANILAGKKTTVNIRIKNKKGQEIHLESSASLMKIDGKLAGMMVIARDVTERKKMEDKLKEYTERLKEKVKERTRELRKSEERYSSIVNDAIDSLESGIFILDKNFKVAWINKAVEKFFGVNKDDLIGEDKRKAIEEKIKYVFEDPERFEKTVLATYDNNTYVENFECHVLPSKDREERFLVHWSSPIKTGAYARGRIEHYYDITKLKQMEQQLLKSEKLAAIGEMATMVGHDLRNPLQAIENATYYLNNELPRFLPSILISQKAVEMLQIINDSVNYADKIIKDLHDFSATKKPTLKKTNINTIVKETLSQVETPENVKLTTELAHLPKIKVDKDMIKRIFLNLATNAIQAMKENGGTLKVSTKKTRGIIEVSFKDTGIGMSKENMKKLFTPFFTTRSKGMGMGLPICKKFVEIHGGSIKVESKEGKGTTFTVKLPIQQ